MNNRLLICLLMLAYSNSVIKAQEEQQQEQAAEVTAPAQLSLIEREVSPEIKEYVHKVLAELDIKEPIAIYQPSKYALNISPVFKYPIAIESQRQVYINEEWFNQLSDSEKRFLLGIQLMKIKNPNAAIEVINRKGMIAAASCLSAGGVTYLTYKYLEKNASLSKWPRFLLCYIVCVALTNGSKFVADKVYDKYRFEKAWKQIIDKLDCLDGAIGSYKRLTEEIAPDADTLYWKEPYQCFKKGLAYFESLKKQQARK